MILVPLKLNVISVSYTHLKQVEDIYQKLYPRQKFSIPNLLIGGIAFRDQIYITRIPVIYGMAGINLFDFVDIDPSELALMHNVYFEQYKKAVFSICDLYDIALSLIHIYFLQKSLHAQHYLNLRCPLGYCRLKSHVPPFANHEFGCDYKSQIR